MGNIFQSTCTSHGTVISIKCKCFEKPIKIYLSDDDEDSLKHIEAILGYVRDKKLKLIQNDSCLTVTV